MGIRTSDLSLMITPSLNGTPASGEWTLGNGVTVVFPFGYAGDRIGLYTIAPTSVAILPGSGQAIRWEDTQAIEGTPLESILIPIYAWVQWTYSAALGAWVPTATSNTGPVVEFGTTAGTAAEGNDPRLSDQRVPLPHYQSHAAGGPDEITIHGLAGRAASPQTADRIQGYGNFVVQIKPETPQPNEVLTAISNTEAEWRPVTAYPAAHASSHAAGGPDQISAQGLPGQLAEAQLADRIRTSGAPVLIDPAPPAAGAVLTAISGSYAGWRAGAGTGDVLGPPSSVDNRVATFDGTTGKLIKSTATPNLGTPAAAVLTNATGLPVATGISGLGTGIAAFLANPTSANLRAAIADETGTSGALVFAGGPTLANVVLGTPASGTLGNCTPWTAGGTQTGNATAAIGTILYMNNSAPAIVTLPAAAGGAIGKTLAIKRVGTAEVTIRGAGTDTIDGGASITMDDPWQCVSLLAYGTGAWVTLMR